MFGSISGIINFQELVTNIKSWNQPMRSELSKQEDLSKIETIGQSVHQASLQTKTTLLHIRTLKIISTKHCHNNLLICHYSFISINHKCNSLKFACISANRPVCTHKYFNRSGVLNQLCKVVHKLKEDTISLRNYLITKTAPMFTVSEVHLSKPCTCPKIKV